MRAIATENLPREDLARGDEARQYQRLLDISECRPRDLAEQQGIDRERIARRIVLLQEAPAGVKDIDAGRQTLRGALASLSHTRRSVVSTPIYGRERRPSACLAASGWTGTGCRSTLRSNPYCFVRYRAARQAADAPPASVGRSPSRGKWRRALCQAAAPTAQSPRSFH